mmetsp:Transcript_46750/g.146571  ORF Transcript_46750/g.146571 Transcript_46750/m.146571 type:complete len:88 (+) Transcript_46750:476-739(+)
MLVLSVVMICTSALLASFVWTWFSHMLCNLRLEPISGRFTIRPFDGKLARKRLAIAGSASNSHSYMNNLYRVIENEDFFLLSQIKSI